jgi:20S proteasome alpha/beta subunit
MTCIVGVKTDEGIFIGADSFGGNEHVAGVYKTPKVFGKPKVGHTGAMIFGFTTSWRLGQILQNMPAIRKPSEKTDFEFLSTSWIDTIREQMTEAGFGQNDSGREEFGTFILGFNNTLYEVGPDYSIIEPLYNYVVTGSGVLTAYGSLATTEVMPKVSAKDRILAALSAAEVHEHFVRRPFNIIGIKKGKVTPIERFGI